MHRRLLVFLVVVMGAACGPRELRVTMNSDNNSGQSGFATLTEHGTGKMTVYVETNAPQAKTGQRAHIHQGTCGEIGKIEIGLVPLSDPDDAGVRFTSTTEVTDAGLAMFAKGEWAINVHDPLDNGVYVACGEVPRP